MFTFVVGTYEHLLYGFDIREATQEPIHPPVPGKEPEDKNEFEDSNYIIEPCFISASHQGHVRCLTARDNLLASGAADETAKYVLI